MHVKTLLVCKPFLMSAKSIQKHKHQTQIDEELPVGPFSIALIKKIYKHAHTLTIVTTPSSHTLRHDWMHIAQHAVTKFELSQYTALKVCRFYTTLGLGHMFVTAQHTVTILTRNVTSSQRSTKQICWVPVKIV